MNDILEFDSTPYAAEEWMGLKEHPDWPVREKVDLAFIAIARALRDRLPMDEAPFVGQCHEIAVSNAARPTDHDRPEPRGGRFARAIQ